MLQVVELPAGGPLPLEERAHLLEVGLRVVVRDPPDRWALVTVQADRDVSLPECGVDELGVRR